MGKNYRDSAGRYDRASVYSPADAIDLVKSLAFANSWVRLDQ